MVNLVEYLIAERIIVEARGASGCCTAALADIESGIPESVRQLIERQIERLTADERRVLEGASVVGMECSSVAIGAGLEEPTDWVEEHCEALVRRHQFLSPARLVELPDGTITPRYKFGHVLYLEVPYRLLPACGGRRFTGVSATAARRSTARASERLRRSWPCTSSRDTTRRARSATCSWRPRTPGIDRPTTRPRRWLGAGCRRSPRSLRHPSAIGRS